jgi:hypothetical protein
VLKLSDRRLWDNNEPVAILNKHVSGLGFPTYSDSDDLDNYEAVELEIDGFLFSIRTYAGFPKNTCSIYFPFVPQGPGQRPLETVTYLISRIVAELRLTQADVQWQRATEL